MAKTEAKAKDKAGAVEGAEGAAAGAGALVVIGAVGEGADGQGEHAEILYEVRRLRDQADRNQWALAAVLVQVYRGGYYHEPPLNCATWADYVERELDFHIRKAQWMIRTEEWLMTLPKNVQAWLRTMTWTKVRMLVGKITAENAADWRARVEGRTVMEIDRLLQDEAKAAAADPDGAGADAGPERQPKWSCVLSPSQRANVERALQKAADIAECDTTKDRLGYLLDLVCMEYLATNNAVETVQEYLATVESVIGLKLIAYNLARDEIAYGGDTLDDLKRGADGDDDAEEAPASAIEAPPVH